MTVTAGNDQESSRSDWDLYESFGPWLLGYAKMLHGPTAEDSVHAAFEALAKRNKRPLPVVANPRGYLVRVVQRESRKNSVRQRISLERRVPVWEDHYTDPDIARALGRLSSRQRQCLSLRYGRDLTVPQIADLLQITDGSVKQHLSRGLTRLRKQIGESDE